MKIIKKQKRFKTGSYKIKRIFSIIPRTIEYQDEKFNYSKIIWLENIIILEKCYYRGEDKWEWREEEYFENRRELDMDKINDMLDSSNNDDVNLALGLLNAK